jgi:hypothetical protein
MLEVTIMAEHEGNVYCKQCYSRKFGIRGVGFGVGAGALAMDTGDRFGNTESLTYVTISIYKMFKSFGFVFRNKPNYSVPPGASSAGGKAVPAAE